MKQIRVLLKYRLPNSTQRLDTWEYVEYDEGLEVLDAVENALLEAGFHTKEDKDLIIAVNIMVIHTESKEKTK